MANEKIFKKQKGQTKLWFGYATANIINHVAGTAISWQRNDAKLVGDSNKWYCSVGCSF